jgi:hypothetical protein
MSVYESFIKANHALFACYEAVPNEEFQAMSKAVQQDVCKDEKAAVATFLKEDSVHFRSLIQARIASFDQQQ